MQNLVMHNDFMLWAIFFYCLASPVQCICMSSQNVYFLPSGMSKYLSLSRQDKVNKEWESSFIHANKPILMIMIIIFMIDCESITTFEWF